MKRKGRLFFRIVLSVLIAFLFSACCNPVRQLGEVKTHWNKGDYAWVAKQDLCCKTPKEGCNQLHLLKGDACYRLAKQGRKPKKHFECAVYHLQTGINQTTNWKLDKFDLNRVQTYINLCESLRELQFMETGEKSEEITQKLSMCAKEFLALEPENLAAIYYLNIAGFVKLTSCFSHPERCPSLCQDIKVIITDLENAMPRVRGTKYEPNYDHLHRKCLKEQELAGCP